ncbi:hypothetical protein TKK_0018263 [Trichogramma kaykai]
MTEHEMSDSLKQSINEEWQLLPTFNLQTNVDRAVDKFWTDVNYVVDDENRPLFANLSSFALLSMVIVPNSNASAERVWSKMNLIKT